MPGIHLDVWGTTWLCEKAREGSRLPPEVRLVCKLASKAKPALQNSSVPFGLAQKHLLFDCLSEVVRPGFGQPRPPWFPSRSQLSCSRIRRQKGHMRAAIVDACGQQAVEKLQEAAEQQPVCVISSEFPESCSCLPFTMMEKSPLPDVRSNLIVAAGDLAIRLWDLPVPWTSPLCARLQDPCPGVKQTAGPVLTHVPLQDTVTGKGQGHAVYHLIPGIIRHLWDPDSGLQEESFHAMIRHLLSFLPKGK
ncbi:hypothetical protein DUI87_35047 [Hirundo rustica rustica]|uniref:Condensin complex subunit 1 C-terminal domain-containing protein n=1 Tax=Hirundo rustica rustica TaxID=333673 RepID=A0A3M0INK0_HIRRU|nr:hypothetical protein DUI87_35047 [Hirundo rustica rustica]